MDGVRFLAPCAIKARKGSREPRSVKGKGVMDFFRSEGCKAVSSVVNTSNSMSVCI
jgi:hypothetical protein